MKSISFDRAAGFYDETRSFPPGIGEKIATSLASRLPLKSRLLEIGLGTGRIAKPLSQLGIRVTGLDLSSRMMHKLLDTILSGELSLDLIQADATRTPFKPASFDAVVAVHIFHLIPDFKTALLEVRRVLKPGGALFCGVDWHKPDSPYEKLRTYWRNILDQTENGKHPGVQSLDEVKTTLSATSAQVDEWEAATWERPFQVERYIRALEKGVYSSTWRLSPDDLTGGIAMLRQWAFFEYGTLDIEFPTQQKFIWQRIQLL